MPADIGRPMSLWRKACAGARSDPGYEPVRAAADRTFPFFRFPRSSVLAPAPPTTSLFGVRFAAGAWLLDSSPRPFSSSTACQHPCQASTRLRAGLMARDLDRIFRRLGFCR